MEDNKYIKVIDIIVKDLEEKELIIKAKDRRIQELEKEIIRLEAVAKTRETQKIETRRPLEDVNSVMENH